MAAHKGHTMCALVAVPTVEVVFHTHSPPYCILRGNIGPNSHYLCVCVVCVYECECMCVCMRMCACMCVCVRMNVCV